MIMKIKYNWKRFWSPPEAQISLSDGGFLQDPTDAIGKYVNPDLIAIDSSNDTNCLILLGEPGIGKSVEIKGIYESVVKEKGKDKAQWIDLRDFMSPEDFTKELESNKNYLDWVKNGDQFYLFLDSFDEGVFSFPHFARAFSHLLTKNSNKLKTLFLRISCRTAVWPSYLESSLEALWGEKGLGKYELSPLTKADVVNALESRGVDKDKFLAEVNDKGVTGLAGKPLTLQMLMSVFEQNGCLPSKKAEIYTQGCNLLLQEPDLSKKTNPATKPKLSLTQRVAIAERIAVATLICGKSVIVLDDTGGVSEGELSLSVLQGNEILNDSSLAVGEDQILEVLNTGLFSSRGDGKMGWAHQTYGEFLAARYLVRHNLNWKQIRSFLFQDPLKIGVFQVVPQLYEVSAWFASLDSNFFDNAVLLDPESLMLSDANVITDSQKKTLTEQLLLRLANGELFDRWETFNYTNYRKLCHPDIANQLQPYINDSSKGIVVRRAAIDIASACLTSSLEDILVKIALEGKENLSIRARATKAIAEIGSDNAKKGLKILVNSGFKDDPEDELKGAVLQALWPGHISTEELFSLLTPPKRHNFLGSYYGFTERHLVSEIHPEDILIGLDWVEKNAINARSIEYYLGKLADAIMLKAWENLFLPVVLKKFAAIVYARLKDFEEVVGEHAMDDETVKSFQKSIEDQDEKRRSLIKEIVNLLTKEKDKDSGRKGYILLPHGKIRLVSSKDLPWLVQWIDSEKDEETQKLLAEVIYRIFDIRSVHDIELVCQARNRNTFLKQDTHFWFEAIKLDSEEATEQRKRWRQEQEWEKKREKDEKEEILKVVSPSKIKELLEKAETGDTDSWWRLNNAMCLYQHELDEEDIRKLPGWKVIDEEIQERIIKCGKTFILNQESKPEIWLGKGKIYFPALAGYRALQIYYEKEKGFVEGLGKDIWKKWAPITIGMPLISNDPENGKLIAVAYKNAPEEIIQTLDVLIDEDEQKHGNLFLIDLLDGCVDMKMSEFLLSKAKKPGFNPKATGDIMRFLLRHKVQSAKDYVKSLIQVPMPTESDKREQGLIAAVALIWSADRKDWEYLWDLIQKDKEFGRLLIEKAHDNPLRGSGVLQQLSENQLAELYIWLMKEFPPEKYSQPEGAHTVTPQISIGEWRDSVLRVLMDKGTAEACKQIQKISVELSQYKWIKEFTLIEARRIALQKSWQPPQIDQLLKLVENHELRLINTPDELMDIILDSLEDLENKLLNGNQPQAIDLWNEKVVTVKKNGKRTRITISSPKDEIRLSNKIKNHLDKELKGIVVDREVDVQGNKTDIYISAFSRDHLGRPKDVMKVTIEVKGCWNNELDTAMESQLIDKYLTGTECNRGIYLIGWFVCDRWNDQTDSRLKKSSKIDIKNAKEKYSKQAKELSSKNAIRVESVVLDTRL